MSEEGRRSVLACLPVLRSPVRPCSLLVLEKGPIDRSLPRDVVNIYMALSLTCSICPDKIIMVGRTPHHVYGNQLVCPEPFVEIYTYHGLRKKNRYPLCRKYTAHMREYDTHIKSFESSIKTRFFTPERKSMKA